MTTTPGAHWQGGKYVPDPDNPGQRMPRTWWCFASIEDAADEVGRKIVEWVQHAYDEWDLGIDGATPLRHAVQHMERAEQQWGDLRDSNEDPGQWLREGRQSRVGHYFIAACGGDACEVHPPSEDE
jgi:hypothetical protein